MANCSGSFSIYHKTLEITIDDQDFNLSDRVSPKVWNIGGDVYPKNLEDDWEIRNKLHAIVKDFIVEFDNSVTEKDICIII